MITPMLTCPIMLQAHDGFWRRLCPFHDKLITDQRHIESSLEKVCVQQAVKLQNNIGSNTISDNIIFFLHFCYVLSMKRPFSLSVCSLGSSNYTISDVTIRNDNSIQMFHRSQIRRQAFSFRQLSYMAHSGLVGLDGFAQTKMWPKSFRPIHSFYYTNHKCAKHQGVFLRNTLNKVILPKSPQPPQLWRQPE